MTMARFRYLLDYTLLSLARRWGRQLSLLIVYALLVLLLASVMLLGQALRWEAGLVLSAAPDLVVQRLMAGRQDLVPNAYLSQLTGLRGVTQVRGRLWGYYYDSAVGANYTVMTDSSLSSGDGAIGTGVARVRQLGVGDWLGLQSSPGHVFPLRITRLLEPNSELVSADLLVMGEEDFRRFFTFPRDSYTDLVLTIANPREVATIAEKVRRLLPDTRPISKTELLRSYDSLFTWREGIGWIILVSVVLAFLTLAWERASGLSAEEQREIGILKAIGWETGDVLGMKLAEGLVISLTAFLFGYLAAWLTIFHGDGGLFMPLLKGWAVLYPHFHPLPHVDGGEVATLLVVTVFPYTIATLVPVWRVAIADPDTVMRG